MAKSLPFARTVICAMLACITKPSNLATPGFGLGLTALTTIGATVSTMMGATTGTRPCACADEQHASARNSAVEPDAAISLDFIRIVRPDSQGFEETYILRS